MAKTADTAFSDFNIETVNLNSVRNNKASRDWLWGSISINDSIDIEELRRIQDRIIKIEYISPLIPDFIYSFYGAN